MARTRDVALPAALCIAAAITAAYLLNEWVLQDWWHPPRVPPDSPPDKPSATDGSPTIEIDPPALEQEDPNTHPTNQTRSLPPLRTHSLPPPLPNGRALLPDSSFASNSDAMTSSDSLHTLSSQEGEEAEGASLSNTSDTDSEPFVDVLSPPPTHVVSRRRSFRNHDLFAASHISFSELGSLVAPQDEAERPS